MPGLAQEEEALRFDIPAMPASSALNMLGRQANKQLLYFYDEVQGITTQAVVGEYTLDIAIELMLRETGLVVTTNDRGVLTVSLSDQESGQTEDGDVNLKSKTALTATAAALAISSTVNAQGDTNVESEFAIDEIVVTALKREQSLEEVPFSIQAFGNEAIERAAIRDLSELITFVPGASEALSVSIGRRNYQIRGIEQGSGSPTIGYYLGEAALFGNGNAPGGRMFDIERVEVIRGPQSTLYGNGAMGGVIRFIPKAPNLEQAEASVRAGYSSTEGGDDSYHVDGALSIPLVENTLGLRVVASTEEFGGYYEDSAGNEDANDGEVENVRATLLWKPSENLGIEILYADFRADQNGGNGLNAATGLMPSLPGDFNNSEYDMVSGTLEYDFGFASLSSTVSQMNVENESLLGFPFPFSPTGILEFGTITDRKVISNETRLTSGEDSGVQWIVGVFYTDFEDQTNLVFAPEIPAFGIVSQTTEAASDSIAYFGEVSWDLLDGKLVPLLGLRQFEEDISGVNAIAAGFQDGRKFDNTSGRLNISWFPTDDAHYYVNLAQGFRSGAFNGSTTCDLHILFDGLPCELAIGSDDLDSYEVGTKQSLADGQFMIDAAVYFQDWEGVRNNHVASIGTGAEYQVGDAEVYGIDLGFSFAPAGVDGLTFQFNGNWNSAEWVSINDPALSSGSGVNPGDRLNFVPEWTATFGVDYSWEFAGDWSGLVSTSYTHLAPQFGQFGNALEGDARDLLRVRLGAQNGRVGVFLYGNNLLNEDGAIFIQNPAAGIQAITRDRPRQVGIEFTYDFD